MTTENSNSDMLVDKAIAKMMEEIERLSADGQKYITANELLKIFIEVWKTDVEPNEYIRDDQVVMPLEWFYDEDE